MPETPIIVSIHQPGYFPWIGYIHKIWASNVFVYHDNVQFSKKSFISKVPIRKEPGSSEKENLSIPLKKHSDFILIKDLIVDQNQDWQKKHLNKLKGIYANSPFFSEVFPKIEDLFKNSKNEPSFTAVCLHFLKGVLTLISCSTPIEPSSRLPVSGERSEYNVNLVKHFKGTDYLSGEGAKNYQDDQDFTSQGIKVSYQHMLEYLEKNSYPQAQGPFLNGLSVLDVLFNVGPDGVRQLMQKYEKDRKTNSYAR